MLPTSVEMLLVGLAPREVQLQLLKSLPFHQSDIIGVCHDWGRSGLPAIRLEAADDAVNERIWREAGGAVLKSHVIRAHPRWKLANSG